MSQNLYKYILDIVFCFLNIVFNISLLQKYQWKHLVIFKAAFIQFYSPENTDAEMVNWGAL